MYHLILFFYHSVELIMRILTSLEALTESSLCFSQDISQQQYIGQNDTSMELINNIDGVDEEGRSRQRILAFAAKRFYASTIYHFLKYYFSLNESFDYCIHC